MGKKNEIITKQLLEELGENPEREGLLKTPSRVAKAWEFFSLGYNQKLDDIINNNSRIMIRNRPRFYSDSVSTSLY